MICLRISRSWLEHLEDETWDVVDPDDIESWVSQDLLKTRASFEPVSELDYCQSGMTAIVMGDVNAVHTLQCAHRRHLLAARALNERSLLIRGSPFPRTKTIGDVYIDDFVILCVFAIFRRTCRFIAHRSAACRCKISRESSGEVTSTALQSETGFPLERRVSLMQRLLGGWAFAFAFRREAFACLDVANTAVATLAPSRRCRVDGFTSGFRRRLERTIELTKNQFLAPKIGVLVPCLRY